MTLVGHPTPARSCNARPVVGVLTVGEHTFERKIKMAATTHKSQPIVRTSIHEIGIPEDRIVDVVDRTAKLSDELLKSLESSERAAIEAVGQFVMTLEEALPAEVTGTTDVAKKITKSGFEMVDQLVHTEYGLLRHVVDSAATWLSRHGGAKPAAA
jgi:hypothetical protein